MSTHLTRRFLEPWLKDIHFESIVCTTPLQNIIGTFDVQVAGGH